MRTVQHQTSTQFTFFITNVSYAYVGALNVSFLRNGERCFNAYSVIFAYYTMIPHQTDDSIKAIKFFAIEITVCSVEFAVFFDINKFFSVGYRTTKRTNARNAFPHPN